MYISISIRLVVLFILLPCFCFSAGNEVNLDNQTGDYIPVLLYAIDDNLPEFRTSKNCYTFTPNRLNNLKKTKKVHHIGIYHLYHNERWPVGKVPLFNEKIQILAFPDSSQDPSIYYCIPCDHLTIEALSICLGTQELYSDENSNQFIIKRSSPLPCKSPRTKKNKIIPPISIDNSKVLQSQSSPRLSPNGRADSPKKFYSPRERKFSKGIIFEEGTFEEENKTNQEERSQPATKYYSVHRE